MPTWPHHASTLRKPDLPGVVVSGDSLVSLGLIALLVACLCAAVVITTMRRAVL